MIIRVIQDGKVYGTQNDALDAMGIYRVVQPRSGAHVLPDKWMVWFPNMTRKGGDWCTRFVDGGECVEEVYLGGNDTSAKKRGPMLDYVRIMFAKEGKGFVFKGVFGEGVEVDSRTRRFRKLGNSCELAFSGKVGK